MNRKQVKVKFKEPTQAPVFGIAICCVKVKQIDSLI